MKRALAILLSLCFVLCSCRYQAAPETPDHPGTVGEPASTASESLHLEALNVEFTIDDRNPDMLSSLRSTFPDALKEALSGQGVTVGSVTVTFGASGEATEAALRSGAVQLAFLSAADYYPYRSGMVIAVEQGETPELSLGLIVCRVSDDEAADEQVAEALRRSLPQLSLSLADYTKPYAKGVYEYDEVRLEQLSKIYEESAS